MTKIIDNQVSSIVGTTIPAPMTKRALAIDLMKAHPEDPMDVVVDLIARANQITINAARSYYKWIVKNELAPGKVTEEIQETNQPSNPNKRIYRPRSVSPSTVAAIVNAKSNKTSKHNKQTKAA